MSHLDDIDSAIRALEKLLMADNRLATKEAGKTLADAIATNSVLKELDVSENAWSAKQWEAHPDPDDGPGFAKELADGIKNNGEMTSLNMSNNSIGKLALPDGWTQKRPTSEEEHEAHEWASEWFEHTDGKWQKEAPKGSSPVGAIAIANAISANGALVKLLLGANGFKGFEAGKALGDAIAVNTVLKELDISGGWRDSEKCDTAFAKGFSPGLGTNGAIVKFDISNNDICAEGGKALAEGALFLTRSKQKVPASAFESIPPSGKRKGKTATFEGKEVRITKAFKTDTVNIEWDEPKAKGALTKLDASHNSMFGYRDKSGIQAWANALKTNSSLLELNLAKNGMDGDDAKIFAVGVSANRALTLLNISNSKLTWGKYTNAYGDNDRNDSRNYETDMSGL